MEFDFKSASEADLKSLRKRDPFLYYSIPGVRRDAMLGKPIDMSNLGSYDLNRNATCPARLQSETDLASQLHKVMRKSRISFDCHPDMFLEETNEESSGSDEDQEDVLDVLFKHFKKPPARR